MDYSKKFKDKKIESRKECYKYQQKCSCIVYHNFLAALDTLGDSVKTVILWFRLLHFQLFKTFSTAKLIMYIQEARGQLAAPVIMKAEETK